ncbi:MAG: SH3 domain-containing protein [bacterium]|nr:SH3 domain-containing protein [bacterium]
MNLKRSALRTLVSWIVLLMVGLLPAAVQAQELATPVTIVNVSFLNLRSGPGPEYSVLTQLVGGTTVPVIGVNEDASWFLVETPFGAGWVFGEFTLPRGEFQFVPVLSSPPQSGTLSLVTPLFIGMGTGTGGGGGGGDTMTTSSVNLPLPTLSEPELIVNTSALNVRSGPGGFFTVVAVLIGGESVRPAGISDDGNWFLVEGAFGRGWVDENFVLFRGNIANVPIIFTY